MPSMRETWSARSADGRWPPLLVLQVGQDEQMYNRPGSYKTRVLVGVND